MQFAEQINGKFQTDLLNHPISQTADLGGRGLSDFTISSRECLLLKVFL